MTAVTYLIQNTKVKCVKSCITYSIKITWVKSINAQQKFAQQTQHKVTRFTQYI